MVGFCRISTPRPPTRLSSYSVFYLVNLGSNAMKDLYLGSLEGNLNDEKTCNMQERSINAYEYSSCHPIEVFGSTSSPPQSQPDPGLKLGTHYGGLAKPQPEHKHPAQSRKERRLEILGVPWYT